MSENIFNNLYSLPGVGSKTFKNLSKLISGNQLIDLLLHIPISLIERKIISVENILAGDIVTFKAKILAHKPQFNRRSPFKVTVSSGNYNISIDYFNIKRDFIEKKLPIGSNKIISGKVHIYKGNLVIIHPDIIEDIDNFKDHHEPIYPLTAGINNKLIRKLIKISIQKLSYIPEWIDNNLIKQNNFPNFKESLIKLHNPENKESINIDSKYIKRIAYDEFLAMQIALQLSRSNNKQNIGNKINNESKLLNKFINLLPFELTQGQISAIEDIRKDQISSYKMTRLIQGDVGSGKTIIAASAIIQTIESGFQASFMAPTGVLALQIYNFLEKYFSKLGVKTALLTGSIKGKKREEIYHKLTSGEIDILVGTHALIYEKVNFKNLALAVIDEQHRFGVKQRLKLTQKGYQCDLLLMSATPIPRTLALSIYGDMDVTIISDKPKNRKSIDTRLISNNRIDEVIEGIKRAINKDEKIYWICPLIEESDLSNLSAVEDRYKIFKKIFKNDVAILHGKMKSEEKEKILRDFIDSRIKILLSTTVIEVGVDVEDATIIVIENSQNFGLAQLHQLRGRVGRGDKEGKCILLYDKNNSTSLKRLNVLKNSNDGFYISEQDLKIRGGGDILGIKQSGLPSFKVANLAHHYNLLKIANKDAKLILNDDPELSSPRGESIKLLLKIFNYYDDISMKKYCL